MSSEALAEIYLMRAFIPLLLLLFVFAVFAPSSKKNKIKFYEFAFKLNPKLGLADQWPLRFWLSLIISYFISTGLICWSGYSFAFTSQGFEIFINISKIPLAILSLTLPIGLFISSLHSTQQTAAQILESEKKNNMESYYNQRKFFVEYINSIETIQVSNEKSIEVKVNQALYTKLFNNASTTLGASNIDTSVISDLLLQIQIGLVHLELLYNHDITSCSRPFNLISLLILIQKTNYICETLKTSDQIKTQFKNSKTVYFKHPETIHSEPTIGTTYIEFLAIFKQAETIISHAMLYDSKPNESLPIKTTTKQIKRKLFELGFNNQKKPHDSIQFWISRDSVYIPAPLLKPQKNYTIPYNYQQHF